MPLTKGTCVAPIFLLLGSPITLYSETWPPFHISVSTIRPTDSDVVEYNYIFTYRDPVTIEHSSLNNTIPNIMRPLRLVIYLCNTNLSLWFFTFRQGYLQNIHYF